VAAVALFPCFMRGKNEYGVNDVEPAAVAAQLPSVPVFGMFCHGELGPRRCLGFTIAEAPQQTCTQHSMTTIVAVHAVQAA
jgi:small ligand-binding sensory domain FIST